MGDAMRHTSPFNEAYLYPLHDTRPMTGTGLGFTNANANKYFITMDYHVPETQEAVLQPGEAERRPHRVSTAPAPSTAGSRATATLMEINPRFIYVWGGGFGYGPKIFGGSYDILGQAHAGLSTSPASTRTSGGHCTKASNWVIDWYSGTQITVRHPGGPASGAERPGSAP